MPSVTQKIANEAAIPFAGFKLAGELIMPANATGVVLSSAQIIGQHIFANVIGLSGSGNIGGVVPANVNLINYNQTGISGFSGLVRFDCKNFVTYIDQLPSPYVKQLFLDRAKRLRRAAIAAGYLISNPGA